MNDSEELNIDALPYGEPMYIDDSGPGKGIYVNPRTDIGFKLFFEDEELLMRFLNGIFNGDPVIKSVRFADKEKVPKSLDGRTALFDLLCTTQDDEEIIVEMQRRSQRHFANRAFYYAAKAVVAQENTGKDWNFEYRRVFVVSVLAFNLPEPRVNDVVVDVRLVCRNTGGEFGKLTRLYFVQLPQFRKSESDADGCDRDRIIYLLKNLEKMERINFEEEQRAFQRAEERMRVAALKPEDRMAYEVQLKFWRDYNAQMAYAKEMSEERKAIKIAKNLLSNGMTPNFVATNTDLPLETVLKLVEKTN